MKEVAPGVVQLDGHLPNAINAYLVGDVLVDARIQQSKGGILKQLKGKTVTTHFVTHGHPDHFGASHGVCEALGIPLWASEQDAPAITAGKPIAPDRGIAPLLNRLTPAPPGHPVARTVGEGDEVGGFTVLETPGHTPGHLSLWRESDRVLITGDVFFNLPRLGPPLSALTSDVERNRESMRRLAALKPALTLFGHGPPLRDGDRLAAVA